MDKYLSKDGVLYFWNKVKALFNKSITGLKVSGRTITYTKGDGTTGTITTQDTTYGVVSKTANGLAPMLPNESTTTKYLRQDGSWVVPPDTKYTHPSYTPKSSGFYKITVDATGHVSSVVAVSKADITELGIPSQDTTYPEASEQGHGLMSAEDKAKLNDYPELPSNAGIYVLKCDIENMDGMFWGSVIDNVSLSTPQGTLQSDETGFIDMKNVFNKYALKTDITGMYKYKGSVTNSSNLPTSGQTIGDTYNIVNASAYGPAGTNVAWDGSKWDALGGLFEIESITNAELDEICV